MQIGSGFFQLQRIATTLDACISYYDNIDDSSKILPFLIQKRKTREAKNVSCYFKPGRSQSSHFFCTAKVRFHLLSLKDVGLCVLVCPTVILKYIKDRMYDFWLSQTKREPSLAESLVVPQKLWSYVASCGRYKDAFHRTVLWPEAANDKILTASEILRCDSLRANDCKPTNRIAAGNDTMITTTDTVDRLRDDDVTH